MVYTFAGNVGVIPMADIILSGYYGFGNAGDEAMLLSILESLKKECPTYSVAVITARPDQMEEIYGVKGIHRFDFLGIAKAFREAKLLISGGGSLLQDVTSRRSIFYYLGILKIAQLFGLKTMLYAQGIGPVCHPHAQKALKQVVNRVDLITVRDEKSKDELVRLGVSLPPIYVTADPVLALETSTVDAAKGRIDLENRGILLTKPLIGFAIREWPNHPEYLQEIAVAADRLIRNGNDVIFLPMQWPEDGDAARKVQTFMTEKAFLLEQELSVKEHLAVIANLDLLVGVRLHGLIFAFVSQVPCVGISYDPKIESFLKLIGEKAFASLGELRGLDLVREIQEKLKEDHRSVWEKQKKLQEISEKNAFYVAKLLSTP